MEEQKRICDLCGEVFTGGKPDGVYSNLWIWMKEYSIRIDIMTEAGMVTEFCSKCLTEIVTQALEEEDRYLGLVLLTDHAGTEARKRRQRKSCPIWQREIQEDSL
jgi:hypothetical protein